MADTLNVPAWVVDGEQALAAGDWPAARSAFSNAAAHATGPRVLEGLARALWWSGEAEPALDLRRKAYAGYRLGRDLSSAARVALWISDEYLTLYDNAAASRGWLKRAERLVEGQRGTADVGWLNLTYTRRAADPREQERCARRAFGIGRAHDDRDLELVALSRLGLARVLQGHIDDGVGCFDEAMAGATGGEASRLETIGDVYCDLSRAAEVIGEASRLMQWAEVMMSFLGRGHMLFIAFCSTCCGELLLGEGNWSEAEAQLLSGIAMLEASGQRSRCVHPSTTLATLRLAQGRIEDAEAILAPYAALPEAAIPAARLALLGGRAKVAVKRLTRELARTGSDNLAAVPMLALLVEAHLAAGDTASGRSVAAQIRRLADRADTSHFRAIAAIADARLKVALGRRAAADSLADAATLLAECGLKYEAARARLEFATAAGENDPELAVDEAERALREFEELGASHEADLTRQLLRKLGARARTGPKGVGLLTAREREVLELLGHGLTNAEIAGRLVISIKTAGHHVSNILSKLGLRSRSEAATYAVINLVKIPVSK